jgi:hypothetical protein
MKQSLQIFLWFLDIEVLRLDPNTVQIQTNKTLGHGILHENVLSNVVLETIDYLVHLSYPTVLEHVTLSTSHHSIQQGFSKDYAVLSTDQQ